MQNAVQNNNATVETADLNPPATITQAQSLVTEVNMGMIDPNSAVTAALNQDNQENIGNVVQGRFQNHNENVVAQREAVEETFDRFSAVVEDAGNNYVLKFFLKPRFIFLIK